MIRIITDSAADYGVRENTKELTIVPLIVSFDGVEYFDSVTITAEEFYTRLEAEENFPKTSCPNPNTFYEAMKPGVDAGDEILVVCLSTGISGTFGSAKLAADMFPDAKITVYDTLQATMGQRILVDLALRLAKEGKTVTEIVAEMDEVSPRVTTLALVDDLSYALKGGRISKAKAFVGKIARIKSTIDVDEKGRARNSHSLIGKARAYKYMKKRFELLEIDKTFPLYTGYTDNSANLDEFLLKIQSQLDGVEMINGRWGPTVGAHAGKSGFGIFYVRKFAKEDTFLDRIKGQFEETRDQLEEKLKRNRDKSE